MNLFLRAKHWLLFLLTFGLPTLVYIFMFISSFRQMAGRAGDAAPNGVDDGDGVLFWAGFLLFAVVLLGWMYAVAVGLQKSLPEGVKMRVTLFKVFFFIPIAYLIALAFVFICGGFNGDFNPIIYLPIIVAHLFSMFCMFYCLYFVAKTLKTVELQREVSFSDFAAEFFLAWFFPIGIWILQPRINKLIHDYDAAHAM